ncbi:MAG TPA: hypothetical protein VM425_10425 [Myxococcota bacterium]|nr:hypothetical protein [Myxococcota bacterium]
MKRLVCVIFCLALALPAAAATVEANWNAVSRDVNGQPESVSHYILYYGETARPGNVVHPSDPAFAYDHQANVGNVTQVQQGNLTVGQTYFFAVAAVDAAGNLSDYSGEVSIIVPEPSDGGPSDGGPSDGDSHTDAGADSGQQVDSGGQTVSGGCGCAAAGTARSCWLMILLVPLVLRKQVRSA